MHVDLKNFIHLGQLVQKSIKNEISKNAVGSSESKDVALDLGANKKKANELKKLTKKKENANQDPYKSKNLLEPLSEETKKEQIKKIMNIL